MNIEEEADWWSLMIVSPDDAHEVLLICKYRHVDLTQKFVANKQAMIRVGLNRKSSKTAWRS